jgi:hypothetical protein
MITTFLQGGLGNQMFQVAVAYNLAKVNGDEAVFNFNFSSTPPQARPVYKYKNNIFKNFTHKNVIDSVCSFNQSGHAYEIIPYRKDMILNGYFQSEKFFEQTKDDLVDKFLSGLKSKEEMYKKVLDFKDSIKSKIVSVHVRRGDYLMYQHIHTLCTLEYYNQAMELIKEKIGEFTPIFISDDKQWCKDTFGGIVSPFNDEIEDFMLMTVCDHNIIANSTFSWWGAYLNQNQDKIVIAPQLWFGPGGPQDQQDTIPNNWIKL